MLHVKVLSKSSKRMASVLLRRQCSHMHVTSPQLYFNINGRSFHCYENVTWLWTDCLKHVSVDSIQNRNSVNLQIDLLNIWIHSWDIPIRISHCMKYAPGLVLYLFGFINILVYSYILYTHMFYSYYTGIGVSYENLDAFQVLNVWYPCMFP